MTIAFQSHGEGQPTVCLPWFGTDATMLAAALEPAFAASREPGVGPGGPANAGWRRIYVDLPGCGGSPGGPEDSDAVLAAVVDFIDREVGPEPVLLAGCSYGGYLAGALARRQPDRVAGLLLVCAGVKIRPADRELPAAAPTPKGPHWLDHVPEQLRVHLDLALGNRTRATATLVAGILAARPPGDEDYLERLRATGYQLSDEDSPASYPGPTSIVTGRRDRIAGYRDQFRALASYPEADFTALADAGHYLPFEQPGRFAEICGQWLDRCAAQR
jgi:pimeloyl-ACP methyl ester carboxylesterase